MENLIGKAFNKLKVTRFVKEDSRKRSHWEAICEHGHLSVKRLEYIQKGECEKCTKLDKMVDNIMDDIEEYL